MRNLKQRKPYIEAKYSEQYFWNAPGDVEDLYGDFVEYMNITFGENDTLEIDVLEITNFNDMPTLIRQMNAMLIAIDAGEPIDHNPFATYDCIDKFTGWDYDCGNEFRHYASVYADYVHEYESIVVAKLEREKLESQNPKKSGGLIKKTCIMPFLLPQLLF